MVSASGNLPVSSLRLYRRGLKLQFKERPLEAGSKRESISIDPHVKMPNLQLKYSLV